MIKIGICDDNITLLQKYKNMIEAICKETKQDYELKTFTDGTEVLAEFQKDIGVVDILFLDILMKNVNGVEAARELRSNKSEAILIFLTSSEEYIFESMDVDAMAYLMKDQMTSSSIKTALFEAIDRVEKHRNESMRFLKNGGAYSLSYSDICFIKIYKGFCYIHHWDGIIFESAGLTALETLDSSFFKVHDQYIINLKYIGKIDKNSVTLSDESQNEIPLDKQYARELKIRFAQYMMEKM